MTAGAHVFDFTLEKCLRCGEPLQREHLAPGQIVPIEPFSMLCPNPETLEEFQRRRRVMMFGPSIPPVE